MKVIRILCILAGLVLTRRCLAQRPNVLFIAVDDLNNWIGCAGNEQAITPNMDKLASEGVYFFRAYLASITFADTQIGEVLDAMEANPDRDNTIIVLWGDHGYHMGEKNTFQKHTLWDRSGVTPLIIKAPKMAANASCPSVVSLLDIYPTLVDLCGLPANDKLRGRSLKPILEDPNYAETLVALESMFPWNPNASSDSFEFVNGSELDDTELMVKN